MIIKLLISLFSLFSLLLFESCQKETSDIVDINNIALADGISSNKIIVWGHSAGRIIEPFLESELRNFYSYNFVFERCSANGERMLQIAARQGSIPAFFTKDICERIGNKYQIATAIHPLSSSFDGSDVFFSIINGVNPCTINNVLGELSRVNSFVYFEPYKICDFSLDSVNLINTSASIRFRNSLFSFFWCDQLVDRSNLETLLEKYRIMVNFIGNDRFLIIGSIRGDSLSHKEIESILSAEFNDHYFNAREYLISEAARNMSNLSDSDKVRVSCGRVPLIWMKDDVHLNDHGAKLLAKEIVRTLTVSHLLL